MNTNCTPRAFTRASSRLVPCSAILAIVLFAVSLPRANAGSATWAATPFNGDWSNAANWKPATIPDGPSDTATFAASTRTQLYISEFTTLDGIVFDASAGAFTLNLGSEVMSILGSGVINQSSFVQRVLIPVGGIIFSNQATAGSNITFAAQGGYAGSAFVSFEGEATAGSATYICKGARLNETQGGYVTFNSGHPSADHGDFKIEGASTSGAFGGFVVFDNTATAASARFRIGGGRASGAGGGLAIFANFATAGRANFVNQGALVGGADGGRILFYDHSSGECAEVELADNSSLDISGHSAPGMIIGSVAGNGVVTLGSNSLAIGRNNLNTTFAGLIEDGAGYAGGGLRKIGTGRLSLISANSYTGSTTISGGALFVGNTSGSATGTGPVQIAAGTLGGTGIIAGAVTIADNSAPAFLAPGSSNAAGTLTIHGDLIFNAMANCQIDLNTDNGTCDQLIAGGVTINSGTQIVLNDLGSTGGAAGTVFTLINNTADTPIAGNFDNAIDGSTLTVGNSSYRISYQGGDGNDLTLTLVE